ncbi:lysine N6-hydroxylase [Micromonospora nigra]|uniref:L-lysine N6-monooxygenase MbtG n=1 Tax=Micromonospora nigra TaxID=145857 RepID=A0A1C6RCS8_9ACTN|nr:SidA/IucD/PvdA family monooxygenase [Micromonospora nigra]SCL14950.1 lysine N6-hydroxylase [Micromonospora nigra]
MSGPSPTLDLVGIGIGPANLSLAALLADRGGLRKVFLERKKSFEWHSGIMVPNARMQVHFLKDLVTPVDPTSPYTFLSFAVEEKRLYRLLVSGRTHIPRREFEQYCRWAADRIDDLRFGVAVDTVEFDGDAFLLRSSHSTMRARNIVIATGLQPWLPPCAAGHAPDRVLHAANLLDVPRNLAGRRVAVVGGGQSGAEVVLHLLRAGEQRPSRLLWGTRRGNLFPLDDSPFVEEHYLPNYSRYFHAQPPERRALLNEQQRMSSDGVSAGLLREIYQQLYDLELVEGVARPCDVMVGHQLLGIDQQRHDLLTTWRSADGELVRRHVDVVICATGYRHGLPPVLRGLRDRMPDELPPVRADFSLEWDGPADNLIFVQNAARRDFGVADPNLSLLAWRSATIANSLLGEKRFDTGQVSGAVDWVHADDQLMTGTHGD